MQTARPEGLKVRWGRKRTVQRRLLREEWGEPEFPGKRTTVEVGRQAMNQGVLLSPTPEGGGGEGRVGQRENLNYDAVAAKASDRPMESSEAGEAVRVDLI